MVLMAGVLLCGGSGLAVHQRLIEPVEVDFAVGQLRLVTIAPHPVQCESVSETVTNPCSRYQAVYIPEAYRIWLFWRDSGQGRREAHLLTRLSLPLRPVSP
jgi:hypothetical protein